MRAHTIKIWSFELLFVLQTAEPFATKQFDGMLNDKLCFVKRWDWCVQGQGHCDGSKP